MRADLTQKAQSHFKNHLGIALDTLLQPIARDLPAGKSVRGDDVYSAISEARREDDALPSGHWEHEPKRADWGKVSEIAAHALAEKSKDLQLAAWLLEAQVHRHGFDGITACIVLMESLCANYWQNLHPGMEDDDAEHRAAILEWVNKKLPYQMRLISLTACKRNHPEYSFADWDKAGRNEKIKAAVVQGSGTGSQPEGVSHAEFASALAATPNEALTALCRKLDDAREAIESFRQTLDRLLGRNAPDMHGLSGLLEEIRTQVVASELHKRGVPISAAARTEELPAEVSVGDGAGGSSGTGNGGGSRAETGAIRDRAHAYARLAEAAGYLKEIDPHSPVPYLVQRAVEWGNLNTVELYHEMFVKYGGHISIFELLGIAPDDQHGA